MSSSRTHRRSKLTAQPGVHLPLGATATAEGVNFSIYAPDAAGMWLRLYSGERDAECVAEIELVDGNRTYGYWHVYVPGARAGWFYTWRADGPNDAARGARFDARRELLDPWARLVSAACWDRRAVMAGEIGPALRARIAPVDTYDWEGDRPLRRALADSVIYELHVRGFTRHPSAGVAHPGTYSAVAAKIPYLQALGVTHVELMPVFAFDTQDLPFASAAAGLANYWGYSPVAWFAPHVGYAASDDPRREFRDMVKALHAAGIGVILDVVLNHTAEGGADGPTIGPKALFNETLYLLDPRDPSKYLDFTGCGNTVNCNHAFVTQWLLDCLTFWVEEMHVDGFRVDLASVLTRGTDGVPLRAAAAVTSLERAPRLAGAHLIAEPWDASGLYQVGSFPGERWVEWNGRYRDAVRRFLRGDAGQLGEVATRIAGSSDLYAAAHKTPQSSINFVTCHDGFTLHDLVSYERKHNDANAEGGRDGSDDNLSWNTGVEGDTEDPEILRLRMQRARNFMAILLLSQGVPMLTAGDEVLRTQRGNNNAYCQDNDVSWLDWSPTPAGRAMLRFTRELIALRKRHASLRRTRFFEQHEDAVAAGICWYGERLTPPRWDDPEARVLCLTLAGLEPGEPALHVMINMAASVRNLPLPDAAERNWLRIVDSTLVPPDDIVPRGARVTGAFYQLAAHGIAIFEEG